jgi:hypothetical protein
MNGYFSRKRERQGGKRHRSASGSGGWLQAALCLHVLTLLALLAFLLSACGGAAPPWGYVWTDAQHFETLSWNEQNGQLSGQYSGLSYAQVSFPSATPENYGAAYTGTLSGQTVTLTIGSGLLSQHLTGMLTAHGAILTLTWLDPSSGKTVQQRWVAVSQTQQGQLVAAFNAYEQARGWLSLVQQERQRERGWHDPNASFLATTQSALQRQQGQVEQIQQAQQMQTRCTLVAAYRPLDSSWFTLPFSTHNDGLISALAHFQQAWQKAERSPVPHLRALALPWLLSTQDERRAIALAAMQASRREAAYRADEQAMQHEQQQSKQLDEQVTTLSQGCPPLPS